MRREAWVQPVCIVLFSDVINSCLEQVITPWLFRFRSSSPRRVYDDYYFHVDRLLFQRLFSFVLEQSRIVSFCASRARIVELDFPRFLGDMLVNARQDEVYRCLQS